MHKMALMFFAGTTLFAAAPVQAQTYDPSYPICLKIYSGGIGGGEVNECRYTSMAQCNASASGRGAICMVNPWFEQQPPRMRTKRRYRRQY